MNPGHRQCVVHHICVWSVGFGVRGTQMHMALGTMGHGADRWHVRGRWDGGGPTGHDASTPARRTGRGNPGPV